MKRLCSLVLFFVLSGCAYNLSGPEDPVGRTDAVESPPWSLRYEVQCKDSDPMDCIAGHGFTIRSDGSYELGPSPRGQIISAKLTQEELADISVYLRSAPLPGNGICRTIEPSVTEEMLKLRRHDHETDVIRSMENQLCSLGIAADNVKPLLTKIRDIAKKYYRLPFPSACDDAMFALNQSYNDMRTCKQDSDCAWIGENYLPIQEGSNAVLATRDCALVRRLLVANAFEVVSNQIMLLMMRDLAQRVCGEPIQQNSCNNNGVIDPSSASIGCVSGQCAIGR